MGSFLSRDDDETIARISRHTGLPVGSVEHILEHTHGRTLLPNAFDFIWLMRPLQTADLPHREERSAPAAAPLPPSRLVRTTSLRRPAIFGSYSHKDRKFVDAVRLHLKPLERDNTLLFWEDSKIKAGDNWRDEIRNAIENASAALLFVSANFLASDFIHTNEIPPLLAEAQRRGTLILPLIVGHCLFTQHPVLSTFQAFNDPGRPVGTMGKNVSVRPAAS